MRDIEMINQLMIELKEAATSKQWVRLQDVDRRIALFLKVLMTKESINSETLGAVRKLQYVHQKTFAFCEKEEQVLSEKMAESRRNSEAMAAYGALEQMK